jgi:hypothetical protein
MKQVDTLDQLRVSVATFNRVIFPHPEDGSLMLALERQANMLKDGSVSVQAQPFGGGVHILNPTPLQRIIGKIQFDSERSKHEQDFRILIPPSQWELIKQYCIHHLADEEDGELEVVPHRELTEEFADTINVHLNSEQYTAQPMGFVIENNPVRTDNVYAHGQLTVHLYRVFEVQIVDAALCMVMQTINQLYSDRDIEQRARTDFENGGRGRANSILTLPLEKVTGAYLALPPEARYQRINIDDHELDETVLAILEDVEVPQYQRM